MSNKSETTSDGCSSCTVYQNQNKNSEGKCNFKKSVTSLDKCPSGVVHQTQNRSNKDTRNVNMSAMFSGKCSPCSAFHDRNENSKCTPIVEKSITSSDKCSQPCAAFQDQTRNSKDVSNGIKSKTTLSKCSLGVVHQDQQVNNEEKRTAKKSETSLDKCPLGVVHKDQKRSNQNTRCATTSSSTLSKCPSGVVHQDQVGNSITKIKPLKGVTLLNTTPNMKNREQVSACFPCHSVPTSNRDSNNDSTIQKRCSNVSNINSDNKYSITNKNSNEDLGSCCGKAGTKVSAMQTVESVGNGPCCLSTKFPSSDITATSKEDGKNPCRHCILKTISSDSQQDSNMRKKPCEECICRGELCPKCEKEFRISIQNGVCPYCGIQEDIDGSSSTPKSRDFTGKNIMKSDAIILSNMTTDKCKTLLSYEDFNSIKDVSESTSTTASEKDSVFKSTASEYANEFGPCCSESRSSISRDSVELESLPEMGPCCFEHKGTSEMRTSTAENNLQHVSDKRLYKEQEETSKAKTSIVKENVQQKSSERPCGTCVQMEELCPRCEPRFRPDIEDSHSDGGQIPEQSSVTPKAVQSKTSECYTKCIPQSELTAKSSCLSTNDAKSTSSTEICISSEPQKDPMLPTVRKYENAACVVCKESKPTTQSQSSTTANAAINVTTSSIAVNKISESHPTTSFESTSSFTKNDKVDNGIDSTGVPVSNGYTVSRSVSTSKESNESEIETMNSMSYKSKNRIWTKAAAPIVTTEGRSRTQRKVQVDLLSLPKRIVEHSTADKLRQPVRKTRTTELRKENASYCNSRDRFKEESPSSRRYIDYKATPKEPVRMTRGGVLRHRRNEENVERIKRQEDNKPPFR